MKNMCSFFRTAAAFVLTVALLASAFPPAYAAMPEPEAEPETAAAAAEPLAEEDEEKELCTATIDDDFAEGEILVVIKKAYSEANKPFTPEDFPEIECTEVEDLFHIDNPETALIKWENFRNILSLKIPQTGKQAVLDAIQKLESNPIVKSAEPNNILKIPEEPEETELPEELPKNPILAPFSARAATPNDPYYSKQYALQKISAPAAWNITTGSRYVKVGIIDSGIALHSDLNSNVTGGKDFVNITNSTLTTDDPSGHGTQIAGIIGAVTNNGIGVSGINWNVTMVPLQTINASGKYDSSHTVQAINYAANNNILILNHSIAMSYYSPEETAINNYQGLIVCSAGNLGLNLDTYEKYPNYYGNSNVICVASCNSNDSLASDSNYSATKVDLAAPGVDIVTTNIGNGYTSSIRANGTSYAAPMVTGVAALIKRIRPDLSAEQIKDCIVSSVDKVSALNGKVKSGGRLNAYNALVTAQYYTPDTVLSGDFDGDKLEETVVISYVGGYKTKFYFRDSNAGTMKLWHTATGFVKGNCGNRWEVGDFNGDKKDDIACFYDYGGAHSAILVFLSNGNSFRAFQKWHEETSSYPLSGVGDRFTAGDFNGDGKTDLATMYDYGNSATKIHIFRSNGSNFGGTWLGWYQDMKTYDASKVGCRFEAGDFNGDKKDDLVAMYDYSTASTPYLYGLHMFRSSGQGLDDWQAWRPVSTGYNLDNIGNRFATGDFNGDGRDDVITMYRYSETNTSLHLFTSTGTALNDWTTWYNSTGYVLDHVTSFTTFHLNGTRLTGVITKYGYWQEQPQLHYFQPKGSAIGFNPWSFRYEK